METNRADIQSLISQMNTIKRGFSTVDQTQGNEFKIEMEKPTIGFSATLAQALDHVNAMQQESSQLKQAFEKGDPNVSLVDVTLASQKASVGFDAVVRVRNKFVEAYKDIMNMPV